jgi:hypothetical protein
LLGKGFLAFPSPLAEQLYSNLGVRCTILTSEGPENMYSILPHSLRYGLGVPKRKDDKQTPGDASSNCLGWGWVWAERPSVERLGTSSLPDFGLMQLPVKANGEVILNPGTIRNLVAIYRNVETVSQRGKAS